MSVRYKIGTKKVILIGIDGMVPEILEQYVKEGKLKNLANIFEKLLLCNIIS